MGQKHMFRDLKKQKTANPVEHVADLLGMLADPQSGCAHPCQFFFRGRPEEPHFVCYSGFSCSRCLPNLTPEATDESTCHELVDMMAANLAVSDENKAQLS